MLQKMSNGCRASTYSEPKVTYEPAVKGNTTNAMKTVTVEVAGFKLLFIKTDEN